MTKWFYFSDPTHENDGVFPMWAIGTLEHATSFSEATGVNFRQLADNEFPPMGTPSTRKFSLKDSEEG